jgi:D-lyxose ketol-isomerase
MCVRNSPVAWKKSRRNALIRIMLSVQHCLNPLHVHCRLVERGLNRGLSTAICKWYGVLVYRWVGPLTVMVVWICRRVKEDVREEEVC